MKYYIFALSVLLVLLASGCALPPNQLTNYGIAPNELRAVTLAREGMGQLKRSRYREAELRLRQALEEAPGSRSIMLNLIMALIKQHLFQEAEERLAKFGRDSSDDLEVQFVVAELYSEKGKHQDAKRIIAKLVDRIADFPKETLAPALVSGLQSLLVQNEYTGDDKGAICAASRMVEAGISGEVVSTYLEALLARGYSLEVIKFYSEAANALGIMYHPIVWLDYSMALLAEGNYGQAYEEARLLSLLGTLPPEREKDLLFVRMVSAYFLPQVDASGLWKNSVTLPGELSEFWDDSSLNSIIPVADVPKTPPQYFDIVEHILSEMNATPGDNVKWWKR